MQQWEEEAFYYLIGAQSSTKYVRNQALWLLLHSYLSPSVFIVTCSSFTD